MLSCSNTKASKQIHQSLKIVAKIHMSTNENLEHYVQAKIHNCQNLYQNKQLQSTTSRMTRLLKYVREQTKMSWQAPLWGSDEQTKMCWQAPPWRSGEQWTRLIYWCPQSGRARDSYQSATLNRLQERQGNRWTARKPTQHGYHQLLHVEGNFQKEIWVLMDQ